MHSGLDSTFWLNLLITTVATAFATAVGGLVAALVGLGGVAATIWWQRKDGYNTRLDAALSELFVALADQVVRAEEVATGIMFGAHRSVKTSQALLIEVDRVNLIARGQDRHVMTFVGKIVYPLARRSAEWQSTNLPKIVEVITAWRSKEASFADTLAHLEALDV